MLVALIVILLLVAVVLILAAMRPDQFRIERSATIRAPAERIFPFIDDFHRWQAWSPYEKKDPAMQRTFDGPPSGVGAIYAWNGNKDIGSGRMEIGQSTPSSRVFLKLEFFTPFKASNTAEFVLTPEGDATRVSWAMQGRSPFMSKLMGLVFNFDKMVGKDFEQGLANLRALAEQPA
jgi:carbon monoxide dehydrogenase subunit G